MDRRDWTKSFLVCSDIKGLILLMLYKANLLDQTVMFDGPY